MTFVTGAAVSAAKIELCGAVSFTTITYCGVSPGKMSDEVRIVAPANVVAVHRSARRSRLAGEQIVVERRLERRALVDDVEQHVPNLVGRRGSTSRGARRGACAGTGPCRPAR